jgi:flagellin
MALAIATNTGALMAAASATSVNKDMETSMERLSTGKRINSAKDDAAGVAIASRLSSEIRGTNQAIRNAQDGQALINTAEGAHKEIENILQRMRELAVQSSNDTNDSTDRSNLQAEFSALTTEINRIAGATTWAGQELLTGAGGSDGDGAFNLQVGGNTGTVDTITVAISAMTTEDLGEGTAVAGAVSTAGVDGVTAVTAVTAVTGVAEIQTADMSGVTFGDIDAAITLTIGSDSYTTTGTTFASATALAADLEAVGVTGYTVSASGTDLILTADATGAVTDTFTFSGGGSESTEVAAASPAESTAGVTEVAAVTAVTGVTAVAQISSVDASSFEVEEGDVFTMVVGDVTLTYTAASTDTSISDVVTGLQADDDYAASGFTLTESSDTITATYTTAEAQDDTTITIGKNLFNISDRDQASAMIDVMDTAIALVNTQRAELGAVSNRLDNTVSNLTSISINLEGGRGRIEDADFAAESTSLAKSQILQQASTAMLAQANASKQSVLSLLQG